MQNFNSKVKTDITSRCYNFSLQIIKFSELYKRELVSEILLRQLIRSSTSIGANIVEGKSASSRREYKKFYEIALKSANETKYWICLLRDKESTSSKLRVKIEEILNEAVEIANILDKSVMTLKRKSF